MGSLVTIRPMNHDDVSAVARLEAANQPQPWSEETIRSELETDNRCYVIAEGSELVGFGGVMVIDDEAHVTNLLVDPGHRRQGVGRRLMTALVTAAVGRGARHLTLEVRSDNTAARDLYSSMGLAPVGIRPSYYGDVDALILWAHDIDQADFVSGMSR